jgi:hypothetical protein
MQKLQGGTLQLLFSPLVCPSSTPSVPIYLSLVAESMAALTGEAKLEELSALCRLMEVMNRHEQEDWQSQVVATTLSRMESIIQQLDIASCRPSTSIGKRTSIELTERSRDRLKDILSASDGKLKVEMMTVLMTLKTHCRLMSMKFSLGTPLPSDMSHIEQAEESSRDSHHNLDQLLSAERSIINKTFGQKGSLEDSPSCGLNSSTQIDNPEIEEFLRYEAEINEVLQRARKSHQNSTLMLDCSTDRSTYQQATNPPGQDCFGVAQKEAILSKPSAILRPADESSRMAKQDTSKHPLTSQKPPQKPSSVQKKPGSSLNASQASLRSQETRQPSLQGKASGAKTKPH